MKQVKHSISLLEFKLENIEKKYNLEIVSDKVKFVEEVIELVNKITNVAERDIHIKEISLKYGISEDAIKLEVEKKQKNIQTSGITAESFLENVKKEREKTLNDNKKNKENLKKYIEELILIKVLLYNKKGRVQFKNNISLSVIIDEMNRKVIEKILENIDLDEVRLIDTLLLDENISNRITEILSREDTIFKSDMNIEEKDSGIVIKSFEKRDLEEKMKLIEQSLLEIPRTEENKEIVAELEKEFKEIITKLYTK